MPSAWLNRFILKPAPPRNGIETRPVTGPRDRSVRLVRVEVVLLLVVLFLVPRVIEESGVVGRVRGLFLNWGRVLGVVILEVSQSVLVAVVIVELVWTEFVFGLTFRKLWVRSSVRASELRLLMVGSVGLMSVGRLGNLAEVIEAGMGLVVVERLSIV